MREIDVAIVGAGPYGLSLAAHLRDLKVGHTVFGSPMSFWLDCVPPGMELKSEGPSSDLFDPRREYPIRAHYQTLSRPFIGRVIVPAELFVGYGREFQKKYAPEVDTRRVTNIARSEGKFVLRLEDTTLVRATRVIVATGIRDFAHVPESLSALPQEFITHSSMYGPVDQLRGRKVIVIGGGASAVDLAWSLHERGSDVSILCRQPAIKFHGSRPRELGVRPFALQIRRSAGAGSYGSTRMRHPFFAFSRRRRGFALSQPPWALRQVGS